MSFVLELFGEQPLVASAPKYKVDAKGEIETQMLATRDGRQLIGLFSKENGRINQLVVHWQGEKPPTVDSRVFNKAGQAQLSTNVQQRGNDWIVKFDQTLSVQAGDAVLVGVF